MPKQPRYQQSEQEHKELAILVQLDFHDGYFEPDLAEFKELVISSGLDIASVITGKARSPQAKYYIGSGKAEEIKAAAQALNASVIIVNHPLSASQARNLEELCCCKVIDRRELILDIFAQRARTHEGKLQVELAQLQHLSTRLIRGWTHLGRQKGGIGLRGPGETQLETDRRLISGRIKNITARLKKVATSREQGRRARKKVPIPTVAVVGYTNAGKSTLFNALTSADVYQANQLFATLDPTLRTVQLPVVNKIILADTVGFIRNLPHELVAAFRATLEEACQADLLLHVIDVTHPERDTIIASVNEVLTEIGAKDVPQLIVMNKIDLSDKYSPKIDQDDQLHPRQVWVSAAKQLGLDLLKDAMAELLAEEVIYISLILQPDEGKLRAKLYELDVVVQESPGVNGEALMTVQMLKIDYLRLYKP